MATPFISIQAIAQASLLEASGNINVTKQSGGNGFLTGSNGSGWVITWNALTSSFQKGVGVGITRTAFADTGPVPRVAGTTVLPVLEYNVADTGDGSLIVNGLTDPGTLGNNSGFGQGFTVAYIVDDSTQINCGVSYTFNVPAQKQLQFLWLGLVQGATFQAEASVGDSSLSAPTPLTLDGTGAQNPTYWLGSVCTVADTTVTFKVRKTVAHNTDAAFIWTPGEVLKPFILPNVSNALHAYNHYLGVAG